MGLLCKRDLQKAIPGGYQGCQFPRRQLPRRNCGMKQSQYVSFVVYGSLLMCMGLFCRSLSMYVSYVCGNLRGGAMVRERVSLSLVHVSFRTLSSLWVFVGLFWCIRVSFGVYGSLLEVSFDVKYFRGEAVVRERVTRSLWVLVGLFWCIRVSFGVYGSRLQVSFDVNNFRGEAVVRERVTRSHLYVSLHTFSSLWMSVGLFLCMWVFSDVCGSFLMYMGLFWCVWVSFAGLFQCMSHFIQFVSMDASLSYFFCKGLLHRSLS